MRISAHFLRGDVKFSPCAPAVGASPSARRGEKRGAFRENILHADYQLDTMRLRDFTHTFLFFGVLFDELCRMGMLCRWAMSRCRLFCSPYL